MLGAEESIITFPIHCRREQDSFLRVDPDSRSPVPILLRGAAYCEVQHILILTLCVVGWSHLRAHDFLSLMDLVTSKVTLHSLASTSIVPSIVFLEIILSFGSDIRVVQLMLDPIKVIEERRDTQANVISTRAVGT